MIRPDRTKAASLAGLLSLSILAVASCGKGRTAAVQVAEGEVRAFVSVERVDVRSGPSSEATRVGSLARGAEVRLRGYVDGFGRVLLPSKSEGWLPAGTFERLADRDARKARTEAVSGFAPQPGRTTEPTVLFLGPDFGAAQYETCEEGTRLDVLLADHDFYGILLPGKVLAFAPARSIRLYEIPAAPTPSPAEGGPPPGEAVAGAPPPRPEAPAKAVPGPGGLAQADAGRAIPYESLPPEAEAPVLVTRVDPRYPDFARKAGLSGDVQLRVLVDLDGRVSRVEVVAGAPGGMTEAATEAVRRWLYHPARIAGRPVPVWKVVRVHFAIDGKGVGDGEKPPL